MKLVMKIEKVDNSVIINYENMSYRQIKSKDFIFVFERNKTKLELSWRTKIELYQASILIFLIK